MNGNITPMMPWTRFTTVGFLAALCGMFAGCQHPRLYHPSNESVISGPHTNFHLAFIEFDDQGELWDDQQVTNAVNAIEANGPVFLLVYFHGWKNNAEFSNDNFRSFTNTLSILASRLPKQHVLGVYAAWRGDPVSSHLHDPVSWTARQLSFWSRRAAAERVAGTSATEALYAILQAANTNPRSKVVLIGHSMGALILEKALSQAMVSTILSQSDRLVEPPADLVLLLNSAASSIYARQLISMLSRWAPENNSESNGSTSLSSPVFSHTRPLIISATSKGDWATGKVFPVSMWLSGQTKSFRAYGTNDLFGGNQFAYYRKTAGHNKALRSHKVQEIKRERIEQQQSPATKQERERRDQERVQRNVLYNLEAERDRNEFVIEDTKYKTTYKIVEDPNAENRTPYWVMRVPKTIIKNHDDIFNERVLGFVSALLRLGDATEETKRPRLDKRAFTQMAQ